MEVLSGLCGQLMYLSSKAGLLFAMALGPLSEPLRLLDGRVMPRFGLGVYRPGGLGIRDASFGCRSFFLQCRKWEADMGPFT